MMMMMMAFGTGSRRRRRRGGGFLVRAGIGRGRGAVVSATRRGRGGGAVFGAVGGCRRRGVVVAEAIEGVVAQLKLKTDFEAEVAQERDARCVGRSAKGVDRFVCGNKSLSRYCKEKNSKKRKAKTKQRKPRQQ